MSCDAPASKFVLFLCLVSRAPVIVRPSVVDTVLSSPNLNAVSRFKNPCVSLSSKTIKSSSFVVVKKSVSPSNTTFSPDPTHYLFCLIVKKNPHQYHSQTHLIVFYDFEKHPLTVQTIPQLQLCLWLQ